MERLCNVDWKRCMLARSLVNYKDALSLIRARIAVVHDNPRERHITAFFQQPFRLPLVLRYGLPPLPPSYTGPYPSIPGIVPPMMPRRPFPALRLFVRGEAERFEDLRAERKPTDQQRAESREESEPDQQLHVLHVLFQLGVLVRVYLRDGARTGVGVRL